MSLNSQQDFIDWVENNLPNALGYPVFSIGQEVLFKCLGDVCLGEIHSYALDVGERGVLHLQYWILWDGDIWGKLPHHKKLFKLNPIANNLPTSYKHNGENSTNGNSTGN